MKLFCFAKIYIHSSFCDDDEYLCFLLRVLFIRPFTLCFVLNPFCADRGMFI